MAEAIVQGGERAPISLTVLYDERCPLCRRLQSWLGEQVTLAPLEFVPADSTAARARFPYLDHERTTRVLTVITSEGAVYEGERAWLVCAWSLPTWQPIAENFGGGVGLRLVRFASRSIDGYRHHLIARQDSCDRCVVTAPTAPRRPR